MLNMIVELIFKLPFYVKKKSQIESNIWLMIYYLKNFATTNTIVFGIDISLLKVSISNSNWYISIYNDISFSLLEQRTSSQKPRWCVSLGYTRLEKVSAGKALGQKSLGPKYLCWFSRWIGPIWVNNLFATKFSLFTYSSFYKGFSWKGNYHCYFI